MIYENKLQSCCRTESLLMKLSPKQLFCLFTHHTLMMIASVCFLCDGKDQAQIFWSLKYFQCETKMLIYNVVRHFCVKYITFTNIIDVVLQFLVILSLFLHLQDNHEVSQYEDGRDQQNHSRPVAEHIPWTRSSTKTLLDNIWRIFLRNRRIAVIELELNFMWFSLLITAKYRIYLTWTNVSDLHLKLKVQ